MLHFVTATRCKSDEEFLSSTITGQSIARLRRVFDFRVSVGFGSADGLPAVYNAGLDSAGANDMLVFIHDDVVIDDWLLLVRLREAFQRFDVVGVAGNAKRAPGQASWWAMVEDGPGGERATLRTGELRGGIRHSNDRLDVWSVEPAECLLMDGVFLAARSDRLRASGVRFDTRFQYHFYDLDFCRQCERAGLSMGVWPLALTHLSSGGFDDRWAQARPVYFDKWGD